MNLVLILERPLFEPPVPPVRSYSLPSPLVNTQVDEDENDILTQALEPEQEPEFCPCPFPHTPYAAKRAHVVSPVETDVIDGKRAPPGVIGGTCQNRLRLAKGSQNGVVASSRSILIKS